MDSFRECIHRIPKSELHVHLRGAMPRKTFIELLEKYTLKKITKELSEEAKEDYKKYPNITPFLEKENVNSEDIDRFFSYKNFDQFLISYHYSGACIKEIEDFQKLIDGVLENLKAQNIVYAEILVAVEEYIKRGLTLEDMSICMENASKRNDITVRWIVDAVRNNGPERVVEILQEVANLNNKYIVGLTLGGVNMIFLPIYLKSLDNGRKNLKCHFLYMPESLWGQKVYGMLFLFSIQKE